MGKKSRRPRPAAAMSPGDDDQARPAVGARQPCPCGSGKRYKQCHGRSERVAATRLVSRPFAGLTGECDWVAMREIVPAASATALTRPEYGGVEVTVASLLPMAWPALRRRDGSVLLGLQTTGGSGDPSRDVAAALIRALDAEPGSPVDAGDLPGPGPRLQDVLEPDRPFGVVVHSGFDFWLQPDQEVTSQTRESMERANAAVVPTARLTGVEAAYWCRIGARCHLRWVLPFEENETLDALARLHAAGRSHLLDAGRYLGSFRAHGLLVPVWDLPEGTEAADLETPAKEFADLLAQALADPSPLTAVQRRARAGVVSRQITLR